MHIAVDSTKYVFLPKVYCGSISVNTIPGVMVKCGGQPGHGSQFLPNTAGEKLQSILNSFFNFRKAEEQKLKDNPSLSLGDVTTGNLTMLQVM